MLPNTGSLRVRQLQATLIPEGPPSPLLMDRSAWVFPLRRAPTHSSSHHHAHHLLLLPPHFTENATLSPLSGKGEEEAVLPSNLKVEGSIHPREGTRKLGSLTEDTDDSCFVAPAQGQSLMTL